MNKMIYKELIAFHPGYYVKNMLDEEGMTQEELAKRLQTSGKNVSDLLHGKINLTDEMALRLSVVFDTSVTMWLNLNHAYTEKKLEIERRKQEDVECSFLQYLDYDFWQKLEAVPVIEKPAQRVRELQRYLKVSSLEVLKRRDFLVQYRKANDEVEDGTVIAANAWVQTALNIGMQMEVKEYRVKNLLSVLPSIREMVCQPFEVVHPKLQNILADCGVALVFLPDLRGCGVTGAVKWLNKEKAVVAINSNRSYKDEFWFSLFHEIGHVLQQRLKVLIVSERPELLELDELLAQLEKEADSFAKNMLVPDEKYHEFIKLNVPYTFDKVKKFAIEIETTPGIVARRMQMDRLVGYAFLMDDENKVIPYS